MIASIHPTMIWDYESGQSSVSWARRALMKYTQISQTTLVVECVIPTPNGVQACLSFTVASRKACYRLASESHTHQVLLQTDWPTRDRSVTHTFDWSLPPSQTVSTNSDTTFRSSNWGLKRGSSKLFILSYLFLIWRRTYARMWIHIVAAHCCCFIKINQKNWKMQARMSCHLFLSCRPLIIQSTSRNNYYL